MIDELSRFQRLMTSFLGEPKNPITASGQLQFPCPKCCEEKGNKEKNKFNLEVNLYKGFQCWSCCSYDDVMKGSISKLIKLYGNDTILHEYRSLITDMRNSGLYELKFAEGRKDSIVKIDVELPKSFNLIRDNKYYPNKVKEYLKKRGIDDEIVKEHSIGYTRYDENNKQVSNRIVIPSFDEFGDLNYWTARDYTAYPNRQKYFNPKVERKDIIFNEEKVQWDADITLVEGPFDHIVVPNSIPLLGKSLSEEYKIYKYLMTKANANVNIFLDGDAYDNVLKIYQLLNHGDLYNRVRYIPVGKEYDPSLLFEIGGKKLILEHLSRAMKIEEIFLP